MELPAGSSVSDEPRYLAPSMSVSASACLGSLAQAR